MLTGADDTRGLVTEHQISPGWVQPSSKATGPDEATELPTGNLTACQCVCRRVFASEMAFTVHRYGCAANNEHWRTNLTLMSNGLYGTAQDVDRYNHMQQLREAQK